MTEPATEIHASSRIDRLLQEWQAQRDQSTHRLMLRVGWVQWIGCVLLALFLTPYTWVGQSSSIHLHVWIALITGGLLVAYPAWCVRRKLPGQRAVMACTVAQVTFSCLLIHLTGGRVESHFHIFGSMALLSMYDRGRVLVVATILVGLDHWLRGVFWPQSVFGVVTESPIRWVEHTAWLGFENLFLLLSIGHRRRQARLLAERQIRLEALGSGFEEAVRIQINELRERTEWFEQTLQSANIFTWSWCLVENRIKFSGAWFRLLGHPVGPKGISLDEYKALIHPEDRGLFDAAFPLHPNGRSTHWELELRLRRMDGQYRWFRCIGEAQASSPNGISGIQIDIHERREAKLRREQLQQEFAEVSHRAGMAEIANGVLHNVGNVLNSINTSARQLDRMLRESRLKALPEAAALLESQAGNLPQFFASDPRGMVFSRYLNKLGAIWQQEGSDLQGEIRALYTHVEHVRNVINLQQRYAGRIDTRDQVDPDELVSGAVETMRPRTRGQEIQLEFHPGKLPHLRTCRHSILQILYNLISNAIDSVVDPANTNFPRVISVVTQQRTSGAVEIVVTDNGLGFSLEDAGLLFRHGFTTKKNGHGFGLHSCSLLARNLGGELTAWSSGKGSGARMTLTLPVVPDSAEKNRKVEIPDGKGKPGETVAIQLDRTNSRHPALPVPASGILSHGPGTGPLPASAG